MKIVVDAFDQPVGRLGCFVAKQALLGNELEVLNAEKAIISGEKNGIVEKIMRLRKKGGSSERGPIISKMPDRLLKRMFRGMLPWDTSRGRDAWKRIKCYVGNPENKQAQKLNINKPFKYVTIEEVCKLL